MKTISFLLLFVWCISGNISISFGQKIAILRDSTQNIFTDSSTHAIRKFIVRSLIKPQSLFDPDFLAKSGKLRFKVDSIDQALNALLVRFPSRISDTDHLLIREYVSDIYELLSLTEGSWWSDPCEDELPAASPRDTLYADTNTKIKYGISDDYLLLLKYHEFQEANWRKNITFMFNSMAKHLDRNFRTECEKMKYERKKNITVLWLEMISKGDKIKTSFARTTRSILKKKKFKK